MPQKFFSYCPYLTFTDPLNTYFVKPNGKQRGDKWPSADALFHIGREAYKLFLKVESKAQFDDVHLGYFKMLDETRQAFQEEKVRVRDTSGNALEIDWIGAADNQIVGAAWEMLSKDESAAVSFERHLFMQMLLIYTFTVIDDALIYIDFGSSGDAVSATTEASNALARVMEIKSRRDHLQDARKEMSLRGIKAKLANDPKQTAKKYVKDCWLVWQEEPERYKGKTDFARKMLKQEQCNSLKSQVKITNWCREWEKSHSAG